MSTRNLNTEVTSDERDPLFEGTDSLGAIEDEFTRRYGRTTDGRQVKPTFQVSPDGK